jgi:hypothetical protein
MKTSPQRYQNFQCGHILSSVCEGDDVLVARSREKKDVVVDCLFAVPTMMMHYNIL